MAAATQFYGTGRRKTSTARVFLRPGAGSITVNKKPVEVAFPTETLRLVIRHPLVATETLDKFDVAATTVGGGVAGQRVEQPGVDHQGHVARVSRSIRVG